MTVFIHPNPSEETPPPDEVQEHADEDTVEEFIEWVIEHKEEVNTEYFVARWGLDPDMVDEVAHSLEREGEIEIKG